MKNPLNNKLPLRGGLVGLYGLPYCDATKAVIRFLENKEVGYELHNYKTNGISIDKLKEWSSKIGWEKLLNKRSTTWRSLSKAEQEYISNEPTAIAVMQKNTSLIKRPVIEYNNKILLGFDEKLLNNTFD